MMILITGGAGFIGSTLADRLLKDNNVFVIDNFNNYYDTNLKELNVVNNISNPNYKLYRRDLCDDDFLEDFFKNNHIDVVVHLAASAGVRNSIINPLEYIKNNVYSTVNLLEKMKIYNVKKIVFASSSSVYGNSNAEMFSEDLKTINPVSPYAATKLACEQMLYTYSNLYNIKAVCLRLFTVYGPRQRPDLAIRKFTELIEKNQPISVYGDGTTVRDYTYIDDIVDGIAAAINYCETPYEIINLGGGSPISLNKMISTIEDTLDKKAEKIYLPIQSGDVYKTVSDITKAKTLLNYHPKTNFENGIKKFIEWRLSQ